MLECDIVWEDNRSKGTVVPFWRDPNVFPMDAIARIFGQSAAEGVLPCHQNIFIDAAHINVSKEQHQNELSRI